MKKYSLVLFMFAASLTNAVAQLITTIGSTSVTIDTVYTGLDIPWEIVYAPDNHIWTTERKGIVSRINPTAKTKEVLLDITSTVYQQSESGLLGMVLHPDFSTTPEVFMAYTYLSGSAVKERLVKYTYNGTTLSNPQILIDNINGNTTHNGARLLFLPDTTLLMSTGDAQNTSYSQNLNVLNGKILRLNTDGSIPADNPINGSYVYSYGHRNVQGMLLAPNGKVYLSEHGASSDDEFQILEAGRNYGWPNVEGFCNLSGEITFCNANNVAEPITQWTPTIAPSDLVYYSNPDFPELDNKILMSVLKDKKLVALELDSDGDSLLGQTHYLTNLLGRLRDVCVGPQKEIYLATNGSSWANTTPNTHSIIVITVNTSTGINKQLPNEKVEVYPTLTDEYVCIKTEKTVQAKLYNQLGKELINATVADEAKLDVSTLTAGMYFLEINGKRYKIVKL